MSRRTAARLITSPVAFFVGGVIDIVAFAISAARRACRDSGRC